MHRWLARASLATIVLAGVLVNGAVSATRTAAAALSPPVALKLLVIGGANGDPTTAAWEHALDSEGVPYTFVQAQGIGPSATVTLPPLSENGVGLYRGVVITDDPAMFAAGQLNALFTYEAEYGVRQLDGYVWPSPVLGLSDVTSGALDGTTAQLTAAGAQDLPGLKGPIPFDIGTYGYGAQVQSGAPVTPIIEDGSGHVLASIYAHPATDAQAGVSELELGFDYSPSHLQWLLLAPELIDWVGGDVHLGLSRNYFGQDIDDTFIADNSWSSQYQCTPAATDPPDYTCPPGVANNPADSPPDVQMSAADVAYVVNWEHQTGITLNLVFNGVGACTSPDATTASSAKCDGSATVGGVTYTDPGQAVDSTAPNDAGLIGALLSNQAAFNWASHTWSHLFLGAASFTPQPFSSLGPSPVPGNLGAGTYRYEVTAMTAYGESEPSLAQSITLSATGSTVLTWPEATTAVGANGEPGPSLAEEAATHSGGSGFWGYGVYRQDPGATTFGLVGTVAENPAATPATTYSFVDTGATAPGAAPSTSALYPTATNPGIDVGSWIPATSSTPDSSIEQEIGLNDAFAQANGLTHFTTSALVTGEHSGLENPNMAAALAATGVTTVAADASRQPQQYEIGAASTAPRYPSNIYYNASNWPDEINEYSTLYVASGHPLGDARYPQETGRCVDTSVTTCVSTPPTEASILASESRIMLGHVLGNDPRVGFAHQANLIGPAQQNGVDYGYTILRLIDAMLAQYRQWTTLPLQPMTDASEAQVLSEQSAWAALRQGGSVTATLANGSVEVTNSGTSAATVPLSLPLGSTQDGVVFGTPYGATASAWVVVPAGATLSFNLPAGTGAPVFTSPTSATATVGVPFSFTVSASGVPTPVLSESGALPAGLGFVDNGNGTATISGTPSAPTTTSVVLSATNSVASATQQLAIVVMSTPAFTSPTSATATVGVPFSFTVSASGVPTPVLSESGALPAGLGFVDNGNGTATISGTPTNQASSVLTLSATNSAGSATQRLTITVNSAAQAPAFTSPTSATATVGVPFSLTVSASGVPTPVLRESGPLPVGLRFVDNRDGTGTISGMPKRAMTKVVTLSATNSAGRATQRLTISVTVVTSPPAFTSPSSASASAGVPFSFTVSASGLPAPRIGAEGRLPAGLRLRGGAGSATLSGAVRTAGTYRFVLTARNSAGQVSQDFTLAVSGPPRFTSLPVGFAVLGRPFNAVIRTEGSPLASLSYTGTLPPGIDFLASADGTAQLSGKPTRAGMFALHVSATNSAGSATTPVVIVVF
ncbi:MAG: hypothetical protein M0004_11835 [Actinomycetota bacterium]|nr:hypothetical protein [Actinomycetota bacterium]